MWKAIRRWWKYLGAKLSGKLEESADPKVQLEQAIEESQQQHRRLTEQAANVIANQKQTQMRLERAVEEYEKSNASARQALLLADEANRDGKSDLTSTNVDTKLLEVEQAQASSEAQARLSELRSELGLTSPETEKPAPASQPAEAEKPAEKPSS